MPNLATVFVVRLNKKNLQEEMLMIEIDKKINVGDKLEK